MKPIVLTATFGNFAGVLPCEIHKHISGQLYAISVGSCPPANCEFVEFSTVTIK